MNAEETANRGAVTRTGSKKSGMDAHVRGFNIGARTWMMHEKGQDIVRVYLTKGSRGSGSTELLTIREDGSVYASEELRKMLAKKKPKKMSA
ncbi:hypothetical protein LCGC14_1018500 [marine sediment metagenome]|uniref:Uncharacterized protein n=1 Tax=marine sediment metagenome TaxID=412755 RepID=A0A0F9R444_9ZZZZ